MNIGEKVAYLKGLAEGLEISSDTKNGKILKGILDILEDMAASIQTLESENETLEDYIEEIDEDLGELEKDFIRSCKHKVFPPHHYKHPHHFDTDEFDDYEDDEENWHDGEDEDEYEEESENTENEILDGVVEIKCPKCGKHIFIETDDILDSDYVNCIECGAEITVIEATGCSCGQCPGGHAVGRNEEGNDEDSIAF